MTDVSTLDPFSFAGRTGDLGALFAEWQAAEEAVEAVDEDDENALDLACEVGVRVEHRILTAEFATESDWRVLTALLLAYNVNAVPWANTEAVEALYRRLVIARMPEHRRARELDNSHRRVERALQHVDAEEEAMPPRGRLIEALIEEPDGTRARYRPE